MRAFGVDREQQWASKKGHKRGHGRTRSKGQSPLRYGNGLNSRYGESVQYDSGMKGLGQACDPKGPWEGVLSLDGPVFERKSGRFLMLSETDDILILVAVRSRMV